MFLLSILGILVACALLAWWDEAREDERARQRLERIKWYTDGEDE